MANLVNDAKVKQLLADLKKEALADGLSAKFVDDLIADVERKVALSSLSSKPKAKSLIDQLVKELG